MLQKIMLNITSIDIHIGNIRTKKILFYSAFFQMRLKVKKGIKGEGGIAELTAEHHVLE